MVVGIVILFNLVVLRAEARPVQNLNDASVHRSMIAWASDRIEEGHLPLDGWYPDLALGSSRFHHYQSLPHVLTGVLALATGSERALSWTMYLGMALWPIAVYAGGRLLGWDRWVCAIAAVGLAPDRQRTHARLRVGELRVARLRHLDTAVGDVAVAVRVGPVVACDLEGPFVLARCARAGADGRGATC